jgi:homoserine kinase
MRATVTVPATAANLGPGFDVFGLALDLVNQVTVDTDAAPGIAWDGEGADELPVDGTDMVSTTIATVARSMGEPVPPAAIRGVHAIPIERGLGSSSAAAVAGVVIASLLLELGWEADPWSVFAAAAEIEGHPDNAAPAVFGGFTVALPDGFVHRADPHPGLRPVAIVPPARVPTEAARRALPDRVSRADAVFNVAHAALAVTAFTEDPSLLRRALGDRLHQASRIELGGLEDVTAALEDAAVPWCVSGAGPTVLAFEDGDRTVDEASLDLAEGWRILRPAVRSTGIEVRRG